VNDGVSESWLVTASVTSEIACYPQFAYTVTMREALGTPPITVVETERFLAKGDVLMCRLGILERGRPDVSPWHSCYAESTTARPCSSPARISLEPILVAFIMPELRVAVQVPAAPLAA
jgi:hypothetical protein